MVRHTDLWAICHRYPHRPPILSITADGMSITLSVDSEADEQSAAELVRAVEEYAAALAEWQQQRQACCCDQPAVTR